MNGLSPMGCQRGWRSTRRPLAGAREQALCGGHDQPLLGANPANLLQDGLHSGAVKVAL